MSLLSAAPRLARRIDDESGFVAFFALLALSVGTLVFARDFSHLQIVVAGLPIFVTEAFLALWAIIRIRRIRTLADRLPRPIALSIALYLMVGGVTLVLSLRTGTAILDILRDAALFYYALFAIVAVDLIASPVKVQMLMRIVALSAFPLATLGFLNLAFRTDLEITTSGTIRALSGAQGFFALLGLLASLSGIALRWEPRAVYVATLVAALLAIPLAQSRTLYLALVVAIPICALILNRSRLILGATISAVLVGVVFALPTVYQAVGVAGYGSREGSLAENAMSAVANLASPRATAPSTTPTATVEGSGVDTRAKVTSVPSADSQSGLSQEREPDSSPSEDPNIAWRLNAWRIAFSHIAAHPLTGVGFGQLRLLPSVVAQPDVPVPPHNSLVTIGFVSGLPGIAAFGLVLVTFYASCLRILQGSDAAQQALMSFALCAQLGGMVMLLFNVALEVPYLAMFFWLAIGMVAALAAWARSTRVSQP